MTDTEDPYAELEAALRLLRAAHPGITMKEASPLLPAHLAQQMWARAVDRYLDDKLAELEANPPKQVENATLATDHL